MSVTLTLTRDEAIRVAAAVSTIAQHAANAGHEDAAILAAVADRLTVAYEEATS